MARRRGFIAEWQHQTRLQEQRARREQAATERAYRQAARQAEAAQRRAAAAQAAAERAAHTARVQAEKQAAKLHKESMIALANAETSRISAEYADIDSILEATIEVDDYVDLDSLKIKPDHPPFDPGSAGTPTAPPVFHPYPQEPAPEHVPPPTGMDKLFGGRAKYEKSAAEAYQRWVESHKQWTYAVQVAIPAENKKIQTEYEAMETARQAQVAALKIAHSEECKNRESSTSAHNAAIDDLKRRLEDSDPAAIDEYIGIVLANSAYPDAWKVEYDFEFDGDLAELTLTATVPAPASIPSVKHYRYVAASDEIRETMLSKTDQRKRYTAAVASTTLRTLHEVFEADRAAHIQSISLTVQAVALNPATGHEEAVPLVLAAASRDQFLRLNLAGVEPIAALQGLRAELSKNPHALIPVPSAQIQVRR